MTKVKLVGDDVFNSFQIFTKFMPQVALEMMSKAGNEVRVKQREALKGSRQVFTVTREDINGKKYLKKVDYPLEFGHRESKNKDADPENMANFINSYLMESSMTLVVNGTHKSFRPVIRRDGEIVGVGGVVKGVGKQTHAILQRMNDDTLNSYYPTKDKLSKKKIGTGYAQKGVSAAMPKVNYYLLKLYEKTMDKVLKKHNKKIEEVL